MSGRINRAVALCEPSAIHAVVRLAERAAKRAEGFPRAKPALVVAEAAEPDLMERWGQCPGVLSVLQDPPEALLAGRAVHPRDHVVKVGDVAFGAGGFVVIAGPCSVESAEQLSEVAASVKHAGAHLLRGGAYKPRTSPYAFQGMGEAALELLAAASRQTGLGVVTEVLDVEAVERVASHAAMLQVGARNMQNFALLKALGRAQNPVLLKRGFGCTIQELLCAAEYLCAHGNTDVVLCERGIRSFDNETRFVFDVGAIALLKQRSRLPVIADPSHAIGTRSLVAPVAKAALAAGADGLMVEVHADPTAALSDGDQALLPQDLWALNQELTALCAPLGRVFGGTRPAQPVRSPSPSVVEPAGLTQVSP